MVGKLERNKDLVQDVVENTAHRVGSIASIITTAIVDVTREIGDLVTDGFEMREAAKIAKEAETEQLELEPGLGDAAADTTDDPTTDDTES